MNRNWYAAFLVGALCVALLAAGRYVHQSMQQLDQNICTAYACAQNEDYNTARTAFYDTAEQAEACSRIWCLLVRRNLVDQLNQTLATIPAYCNRENLSDLAVEVARARTQIQQIRQSFFSCL